MFWLPLFSPPLSLPFSSLRFSPLPTFCLCLRFPSPLLAFPPLPLLCLHPCLRLQPIKPFTTCSLIESQIFYKVRPKPDISHSQLTRSSPIGLRQRDRLLDSQVYLKVINRYEIRLAIQLTTRMPCDFVMLYLASLLRVSICLPHAFQIHLTSPATTSPIHASLEPGLNKPPPQCFLHLRLRHPPTSSTHRRIL